MTARNLMKFNLIATYIWLALAIPTLVFWRESILWLALMSLWANVASHWAAYIAGRADVAAEDAQKEVEEDVARGDTTNGE